jgi:hypothetical protein
MTITESIITDLLPIYYSGDCSSDTKALVGEYLKSHPGIASASRAGTTASGKGSLPHPDFNRLEIASVRRTRRILKWRAALMGLAIFFSLAPFSFIITNHESFWLLRDAPVAAAVYGATGIVFWIATFIVHRRTGGL